MAYAPPSTRPAGSAASSPRPKRSIGRDAPAATDHGRGSFLTGLGIGLAVGAAIALLMAPQSGADTRRALRRRGHRVKARAGDAWSDLRYELSRAKRALRRKRREARSMGEVESHGD
jgi:YtxH-like protein